MWRCFCKNSVHLLPPFFLWPKGAKGSTPDQLPVAVHSPHCSSNTCHIHMNMEHDWTHAESACKLLRNPTIFRVAVQVLQESKDVPSVFGCYELYVCTSVCVSCACARCGCVNVCVLVHVQLRCLSFFPHSLSMFWNVFTPGQNCQTWCIYSHKRYPYSTHHTTHCTTYFLWFTIALRYEICDIANLLLPPLLTLLTKPLFAHQRDLHWQVLTGTMNITHVLQHFMIFIIICTYFRFFCDIDSITVVCKSRRGSACIPGSRKFFGKVIKTGK